MGMGWQYWKKDIFENKFKIIVAIILLVISCFLDYAAGSYTAKIEGPHIADVILDHFGPIDFGIFFVWGYIAIICVFFIYPAIFKPEKIHIAIIMFSLLLFARSVFICLTHLVTPPTAIEADYPSIFSFLRFRNDLFFSGHTAVPFLGFLIFKNKGIRAFMLVSSILMGVIVLLMHQHYSIDVFAAFFITYGISRIGGYLFKEKLPA